MSSSQRPQPRLPESEAQLKMRALRQRTPRRWARGSVTALGVAALCAIGALTYSDYARVRAARPGSDFANMPYSEEDTNSAAPFDDPAILASARIAEAVSRATRETRNPLATIIYVDDDANTNGDGTTWATAFNDLQDGLDEAATLAGAPAEIWVAAGTYKPDRNTGDRDMSFELLDNVGLYGGFAGNETNFEDRDFRANEAILTGDLLSDDVGTTGIDENAYDVVFSEGFDSMGVLDGFTIARGGTGILVNSYSNPTIANCAIRASTYGGIDVHRSASPFVSACRIINNRGTGAFCQGSSSLFVNCLFLGNHTPSRGGAIVSMLWSGRAGATPDTSLFVNCTVVSNSAEIDGGGVYVNPSFFFPAFHNCIIWDNTDQGGAGESAQLFLTRGAVDIAYSRLQGWSGALGGVGNTGVDPGFVDPLAGDYRLTPPSSAIDSGDNTALPAGIALDLDGNPRFFNHPHVLDTGVSTNGLPIVDMGAFEWSDPDCNGNGVLDVDDIAGGTSADLNSNAIPDECDPDCNSNGLPDDIDIAQNTEWDCNLNYVPDTCDIASGASLDCNGNFVPDECDGDCNLNGLFDGCDIAEGTSRDCDGDSVPDECAIAADPGLDCDMSGTLDLCDITAGTSRDCDGDSVPDECAIAANPSLDCDMSGTLDVCDVAAGTANDCNINGHPDICDLADVPGFDCNGNQVPDQCDIVAGTSNDCNADGVPDTCGVPLLKFADSFPNIVIDTDLWDTAAGITIDAMGIGNPSEPFALRFNGTPTGGDSISSVALDLQGVASAEVSYWWQRRGGGESPDPGDDLILEFQKDNGNWQPLATHVGSGPDMILFEQKVIALPAEALHDTFRLRFSNIASTCACDDWFVDGVRLTVVARMDCNGNATPDDCDLVGGTSADVNANDTPDECEEDCNANGWPDDYDLAQNVDLDCNSNAIPDKCDIESGTSFDCNANVTPDECELDCNANATPDDCDVAAGTAPDCNGNLLPDACDIVTGASGDCNGNAIPDSCEIAFGTSADCNANVVPDFCDIAGATGLDCDGNTIPDDCDLAAGSAGDCNSNGVLDKCDLNEGQTLDCNTNGILDSCEIAGGTSQDCDANGILDSCDLSGGIEVFFDAFAETSFDSSRWSIFFGASTSAQYFVSPPYSLQLVYNRFIRSVPIDTRGYSPSRLEYWWRGVSTEGGDDLFVYYWDGVSWKTLAVHLGATDPPHWQHETWNLRDLALSEGFRFELVSLSSSTGDYWYVDDVRVFIGGANDCNSNSIPDACEADCDSNGVIDACELTGDIDHDGFVDAADLGGYLACVTGPCPSPPCVPALYLDECCVVADGDADGDVDLLDLRHLQGVFDRVCGSDADCDDGLFCSGVEICVDGLCQRGEYPCTDPVNSFCLEDVDGCTYPPLPGMNDDFESYACGEQSPDFWVDTEAGGSLVVNDTLFDVGCLGNTRALHTALTETNIHSHFVELGSDDWSSISYTGRMMYTEFTGGVGVTFMSQFPGDARYYRLRRHQWTPTFHISPSAGVEIPVGTIDTGVSPTRNVWYRYAIEVTDTSLQTEIRAKVWRDGDPEPATWQVNCYDASPTRLTQGTVGVWSMGDGEKYWDDLTVIASQP